MAYTDRAYFENKIQPEELQKLIGNGDEILLSAIKSADSMINSYIRNVVKNIPLILPSEDNGMVTPIPPLEELFNAPAMIKQCSYDIAMFYLHDRIQYSEIPGWVKDKYNAAIDYLTKVAKGIISLDIDTENPGGQNYAAPDDNVEYFGSETVMERSAF